MNPEHEAGLDSRYNVLRLGVASGNTIASRTSQLLKHLTQQAGDKTAIASLRAKAPVANKLISAIEIAKRDLVQKSHKVYQYTAMSIETVSVRAKQPPVKNGTEIEGADGGEEDEEEAFEVMEDKSKTQEMPILTVYLSLSPIKELRDAYG